VSVSVRDRFRLRRRWLADLLRRGRFEREMGAEMAHHLELEIAERIAAGEPPAEARRGALRDFGGLARFQDEAREARGFGGWDSFWQDLRYAARMLRRAPAFTAVAVATLAVGIGATTAVFSVVDGLLLEPLGIHRPERVVRLLSYRTDGSGRGTISAPDFRDWMEQSAAFEAGALYDEYAPTLVVRDRATKLPAASVGASFFDVLGLRPALGRFFLPEEDAGGANRVVLSWGLWQEAFGADPSVVGRTIELSGFAYTVVGVAPPFEGLGLSGGILQEPRLWRSTPRYFATNGRGGRSFTAIARLAPNATLSRAQAELDEIQARLAVEYPEQDANVVPRVVSLTEQLVGGVRPALLALLAAVGLVLLIACANVANLLLFRATARAREVAMRAALGASRRRIVRQLLVESLLLALAGAAGGVALAAVATRSLVALAAGQLPRTENVGLDIGVLAFATLAACGSALLFGLVPALRATRVDLRGTLVDGERGTEPGGRGGLRHAVVAAQAGLAIVVMLGAGLLGRSLLRLSAVDPGLAVERLAVLRIDPPPDAYDPSTDEGEVATLGLYRRLAERLEALPGVEAVGLTDLLPMSGNFDGNGFLVVGRPKPEPGVRQAEETRAVSPGFFAAAGVPVLRGRSFSPVDDAPDAAFVAVVSASFARRHFPAGDAVGAELRIFDPEAPPSRVVGVVGDVTQFTLDAEPEPVLYVPQSQAPDWKQDEPWILLRTAGEPASLLAAARAAVQEIEPRTPVYAAQPMSAVVGATLARPRFRTVLFLGFAGIAFLLAAIGVYGLVAYAVARRRPEIGVRLALGAAPRRIAGHLLVEGLRPVALGAAVGLAVGLGAARLLESLLYDVRVVDPVTFLAVPAALVLAASFAALAPALSAARLSPARVLRAE
jgi:predicted permease